MTLVLHSSKVVITGWGMSPAECPPGVGIGGERDTIPRRIHSFLNALELPVPHRKQQTLLANLELDLTRVMSPAALQFGIGIDRCLQCLDGQGWCPPACEVRA